MPGPCARRCRAVRARLTLGVRGEACSSEVRASGRGPIMLPVRRVSLGRESVMLVGGNPMPEPCARRVLVRCRRRGADR